MLNFKENIYDNFLVKGKVKETNEWAEGLFYSDPDLGTTEILSFIVENGTERKPISYKVFPESIVKYTKLHDKNGKKIFGGDIVILSVYDKDDEINSQYTCLVIYNNLGIWFEDVHNKNRFWLYASSRINPTKDVEVIGNKIDNPEMLL